MYEEFKNVNVILSHCVFLYQGFIGPPGVAGPPGLEGERVSLNEQLYNLHFTLMQTKCENQGDAICMNESKVACCQKNTTENLFESYLSLYDHGSVFYSSALTMDIS